MTASIERAGMVNGFKGTLRRAGRAARGPLARLSGGVLVTTADVALTQMGVPAALASWQYLAMRWRSGSRRQNDQQRIPARPCDGGSAPDITTRDHERR